MIPDFHLFGIHIDLVIPILGLYLGFCVLYLRHWSRRFGTFSYPLIFFQVATCGLVAIFGAKFFFWIFEGFPATSLADLVLPWQPAGRTFYGSLAISPIAIYILGLRFGPELRKDSWNLVAILCAAGYGSLRLGCFLNGCCWGKITDVSWAVTYNNSQAAMPYLGVPVHPSQLYESLLGFGLLALLFFLRSKGINQARAFLVLFPMGKIITEAFRGDSSWGFARNAALPTNVVVSLALVGSVLLAIALHKFLLSNFFPISGSGNKPYRSNPSPS